MRTPRDRARSLIPGNAAAPPIGRHIRCAENSTGSLRHSSLKLRARPSTLQGSTFVRAMCWEELKFSDRFGLPSVIAPSAAIVWRLSWRPETDTRSSMRRGNAREEVKDILSRVVVSRDHEPTKVWRRVAADCRREGTHIRYTSQGGEHGNAVVPRYDRGVRNWPRRA